MKIDLDSRTEAADTGEIPFCRTVITPDAQRAAVRVLQSGWVTMGPESIAFEEEFASWLGARHVVAVSSCSAALQMALMALKLPSGSAVLTPTLTFSGAVQAILHAGLRPVLVDVDEQSLGVSEAGVAAAARAGAVAMVVQHMAGYPLDAKGLADAAGIDHSHVVEDAAHALGAAIAGAAIGSESPAGCFSFYATKNLPIGEGGAIATTDSQLAERLRTMRLHGMTRDAWRRYELSGSWEYTVEDVGLKANFTDLQAAIGRAQLLELGDWQRRRAELAARYDAQLVRIRGIQLPPRPLRAVHAWHLYIVQIHEEFGRSRDETAALLGERGIGTSVHFIPVHRLSYFRRALGTEMCSTLPVADLVFPRLLSLPLYPGMSNDDVDRVCQALEDLSRPSPQRVPIGDSHGSR